MAQNAIPTPVHSDGEARGDISESPAIAWKLDRDTPYTPSPLLYGDELYFLRSNNGRLSCFNARTGSVCTGRSGPGVAQGLCRAPRRRRPHLHRGPRRDHRGSSARTTGVHEPSPDWFVGIPDMSPLENGD